MQFPFVITYKEKLTIPASNESELLVFFTIKTYLKSKSIENYQQSGMILKFKKGFFGMNTHVFSMIDKGEFELESGNGQYELVYHFYIVWLFIFSTIMAVGMGLISRLPVIGIIAFFVLGFANFIVCLVRQQHVMSDIVSSIHRKSTYNFENSQAK